jgi:cytochrome P450
VALATRLGVDGRAVKLLAGMRRSHGPGPVWVRVIRDPALLILEVDDVRRVLEGSPDPFASDPEAKRKGMGHFQPHALTISRGELWRKRREFTEAVLGSNAGFAVVAREEARALLDEIDAGGGELSFENFHPMMRRLTRRVVLGGAARDDEALSDVLGRLMEEANGLPSEPSPLLAELSERVGRYVEAAEGGSLVARFGAAHPDPDTRANDQVTHWLFAMHDTLAMNVMRALAALAAHPRQREIALEEIADEGDLAYLRACLSEAMRLWPTTPLLSRETLSDLRWGQATVPKGTQVLIVNVFHHRDRERLDYADRFAPEEWTDGDAASNWAFNHFSHGPQGCPGSSLSLLLGTAVLAELLTARSARLEAPRIDPDRPLPHMLDVFGIQLRMEAVTAPATR